MARRFDIGDQVEDLRDDLGRLRADVGEMLQALIQGGRGSAGELSDKVSKTAERWLGNLRQGFGQAGEKGKDALSGVHGQIEERPVASLLVAFAVGIFLGRLLDRR
jgi:ElaB/YqjD/DUF883 family membrane-anchored ribosome-binding protein